MMDRDGKEFWGFSINTQRDVNNKVQKFSSLTVDKMIDAVDDQGWNLHYFAKINCFVVETSKERWHFFDSEVKARDFLDKLPSFSVLEMIAI